MPPRKSPRPAPSTRLDRDAWVDAARKALIREGIERVKVDRLADDLGVSRGSFYWHFKNRDDLLDALLQSWRAKNIEPFLRVLDHDMGQPGAQFRNYVNLWFSPKIFDPDYDSAVRDWARTAPKVRRMVRESDAGRMQVLEQIYREMGFAPVEAEVRARITYYHQVGYYALRIKESLALREALLPTYVAVLAGPLGTAAYEAAKDKAAKGKIAKDRTAKDGMAKGEIAKTWEARGATEAGADETGVIGTVAPQKGGRAAGAAARRSRGKGAKEGQESA